MSNADAENSCVPSDDGALLELPGLALNLLEHYRAEEVGMVLLGWFREHPLGDAYDIVPERLPLVLFVPDIRPLEEWDDEALRLHEHDLRSADLSSHGVLAVRSVRRGARRIWTAVL